MPTQAYHVDGKRVPSVTTILSQFKDPGALMYWSWNVANEVLLEAHNIVSTPPHSQGEHWQKLRGEYLRSDPLKRANFREYSKDACNAGTIAHDYVSQWIQAENKDGFFDAIGIRKIMVEQKCEMAIADAAYNGIKAFRDWIEQNHFELLKTEVPLVSQEHKFGGCLDCLGLLLQKKRVLFDWKTSSGVYVDYLAQIAGYVILWEENFPNEPIEACHLLRFDKVTADFTEHRFTDMTQPKEYFLLLRRAYALLKELEKRVK